MMIFILQVQEIVIYYMILYFLGRQNLILNHAEMIGNIIAITRNRLY